MSASYFDLKKRKQFALDKADSIVKAAEAGHRAFTEAEQSDLDNCMVAVEALNPQITAIESQNTIRKMIGPGGAVIIDGGRKHTFHGTRVLTQEYAEQFYDYVASAGRKIGATLYEGSEGAGGYAVPITVSDQIVPLAPQELAVRQLAMVIPTAMDIKIPVKGSFGTATAKAETSAFTESEPTLSQVTLSAFLAGIQENVSWELAQDVPAFQAFAVSDMVLAQQMYEENLYVNGTGSGQPQGLIGNVGAGVVEEPDTNGNLVSINGTLDILAKLNAVYHPNASFLMNRATSIVIRKAQVGSNLFFPAFTSQDGQDRLHGYPVKYSSYMPTAARGATPLLFGDFKAGFVIGDRGGSGINVKVLDQPLATSGIIILLAYRRTDSRVRRSEAIQSYVIAAS